MVSLIKYIIFPIAGGLIIWIILWAKKSIDSRNGFRKGKK